MLRRRYSSARGTGEQQAKKIKRAKERKRSEAERTASVGRRRRWMVGETESETERRVRSG